MTSDAREGCAVLQLSSPSGSGSIGTDDTAGTQACTATTPARTACRRETVCLQVLYKEAALAGGYELELVGDSWVFEV